MKMIAILFACALALIALASCGRPEPGIEVRVERVEVPVAVACVRPSDIPAIPAPLGPGWLDGLSASQAADLLAASVLELRAYAARADALLRACEVQ